MIPVLIGAVIGVNVGLMVSFHRLFCLSVLGQLLILGFAIVEDLGSAPLFGVLLMSALAIQLTNGFLLLRGGPLPWPLLRGLFTAAAAVWTVRVAAIALPELASGALLSFVLLTAMFLVPALGQIALMWWPGSGELHPDPALRSEPR